MRKHSHKCAKTLVLVATALCTTLTVGCAQQQPASSSYTPVVHETPAGDLQYVLYVGTNDKDTNKPVYTPEESKQRAKDILIQRFGGYTIQEAEGGWIGDDGTEYQEYTLIVYLSDTTLDKVHEVCDVFVEEFHQSSILIQSNTTKTEFYSPKNAADSN